MCSHSWIKVMHSFIQQTCLLNAYYAPDAMLGACFMALKISGTNFWGKLHSYLTLCSF